MKLNYARRLAARHLPRMMIIKLAAIVLDKLMRQE